MQRRASSTYGATWRPWGTRRDTHATPKWSWRVGHRQRKSVRISPEKNLIGVALIGSLLPIHPSPADGQSAFPDLALSQRPVRIGRGAAMRSDAVKRDRKHL